MDTSGVTFPAKFTVMVAETKVRAGPELASEHVTTIRKGDVVTATDKCMDATGNLRVKVETGWATWVGKNGKVLLQQVAPSAASPAAPAASSSGPTAAQQQANSAAASSAAGGKELALSRPKAQAQSYDKGVTTVMESGGRKKYQTTYTDGSEMEEEYDSRSDRLMVRRTRTKGKTNLSLPPLASFFPLSLPSLSLPLSTLTQHGPLSAHQVYWEAYLIGSTKWER